MRIKNQVYPTAEQVGAAAATHASQHASGGNDPITPADIGAFSTSAVIPVVSGGTGADNAASARANLDAAPAYTYGTNDLTAGTSELETGKLYFVYE